MKKLAPALAAVAAVGLVAACGNSNSSENAPSTPVAASTSVAVAEGSPSAVLASTPWETTSAKEAHGGSVALTDDAVKNYVGFAYFKADGTFTMFTLDDSPKMHGDWTVSPDGKTRTIVAKNAAGQVQSRRVVDIVTLTDKEFTYRVYPDANDKSVYYDIVHTPTNHKQPTA